MIPIRLILMLLLFGAAASAATAAAEVVYPPGSRIGLTPPAGMTISKSFSGFENRDHQVAIVIAALPVNAYDAIEKSLTDETLLKQGVTVESRAAFPLPSGQAVLTIGRQDIKGVSLRKWIMVASMSALTALITVQVPDAARTAYPDAAIRDALASLAVRDSVPVDEQLGLLPFRVADLAGFKLGGLLAGRAVVLTDGATDAPVTNADTHIIVSVAAGGPARASDRDRFAYEAFRTIPRLKDVRVSTSEQLRITGQFGHQIMAQGKDQDSGVELRIVQWIRFSGGGYLHMVGISPSPEWPEAYIRFRKVRDGISLR
jgi:hypothetical protein